MPLTATIPEASPLIDPIEWFVHEPTVVVCAAGFCLWVSICLIMQIWIRHRQASLVQKLVWSFVVLLPLFGWLAYGGGFPIPDTHNMPAPPSDTGGFYG